MTRARWTRLGQYEIAAQLGAGGMGEVYRARDTKLGRDVAIKVLPESLAGDADRLARFEREARVLASLNHPNIAAIHGLEECDGVSALVLELVEGETLEARIQRAGRGGIGVGEALAIARQICDALDAAHERGIVHRDLKPANIIITPDETVKVLDFGLAREIGPGGSGISGLTHSPTVLAPTLDGVLLGTAPYMSPEQARGKAVDKRADIWAFGCVLYEMLTGSRAFVGETTTDVLAAIVERQPDWTKLPVATPANVRRLIERCLEKDLKRRLRDAGDARVDIDGALTVPAEGDRVVAGARSVNRAVAAAVLVATAAGSAFLAWTLKPAPATTTPTRRVTRLAVVPAEPLADAEEAVAVSPDGARIAYVAGAPGRRRIYLRELDRDDSVPIAGTDAAEGVAFSADGRSIAFLADRKLKTVAISGGSPLIVREPVLGRGFDWVADGSILFNPATVTGIWRVRPESDAAEVLTKLEPHEDQHRFPKQLPDGRAVLFSAWTGGGMAEDQIYVQVLETGRRFQLVKGTGAQLLPTGHLVYARGGSLFAVPFDPLERRLKGTPAMVLDGVRQSPTGTPQFSVSRDGTLVYATGNPVSRQRSLVWVDRGGVEQPLAAFDRPIAQPRLSPDGRRVAVVAKGEPDVWQLDVSRGSWTRLTFDGTSAFPAWTPDGRLTFSSGKTGPYAIYRRTTTAADERLVATGHSAYPMSWTPDGRLLAFVTLDAATAQDIWLLDVGEPTAPRALVHSPFGEGAPVFSPDGRLLAYASNESGRPEIYVQPSSGPGEKVMVSAGGGIEPIWSRTGELFYRNGNALMSVDVALGRAFAAGKPRVLFDRPYEHSTALWADYDVDADGRRFLMIKDAAPPAAPAELRVVTNWFGELATRVPVR